MQLEFSITMEEYTVDFKSAFKAFEEQLNTLCLNEFPCGKGNWVG